MSRGDRGSGLVEDLAKTDLFAGLSRKSLDRLGACAKQVDHQPGHVVTEEGHGAAGFHLVLEGKAEVLRGDKQVGTLGPGDYFGELSLIDGKPRAATVRADGPLKTAWISSWDFAPLLEEPTVALALLRGLCRRVRDTQVLPAG